MTVSGPAPIPPTTVVTPRGTYLTVPGEVLRAEALVLVPLVDPWTGLAPGDVAVRVRSQWLRARVAAGHLVLTGLRERAMPRLATDAQSLDVRLLRPGRPPQDVTVTVPAGAAVPWTAPPLELTVGPVALAGRVRRRAFPHTGVADALVRVTGAGSGLVALRTPLALEHASGVVLDARPVAVAGAGTLDAAPAGATRVVATGVVGAGDLIAVGAAETVEHVRVAATEPGGVLVLATPLVRTVLDAAPVSLVTLGAVTGTATLARTALAGDGLLVADADLADAVVEVSDGARTEVRAIDLRTDAAGGWRLAGVRGVPALTLTVSATGLTTVGPTVHPVTPIADPVVVDVDLPA